MLLLIPFSTPSALTRRSRVEWRGWLEFLKTERTKYGRQSIQTDTTAKRGTGVPSDTFAAMDEQESTSSLQSDCR